MRITDVIGEEKYWGRGIASLVIPAMIARAKEIGTGRLYASIYKYNERSIRLFSKFGYAKYREDEESDYFVLAI